MIQNRDQKRLVVYIPAEDHKRLRIELMRRGTTVSAYLRKRIYELLDKRA